MTPHIFIFLNGEPSVLRMKFIEETVVVGLLSAAALDRTMEPIIDWGKGQEMLQSSLDTCSLILSIVSVC